MNFPFPPQNGFYLPPRSQHRLHALLSGFGRSRESDPSYSWHGLRRGSAEFAVFQVTLAGEGALRYQKTEYTLRPGSMMILTVPDDHHYWVEKGKHWEFFYLSLIGQEMMRACQVALLRRGPVWEISEDSVLWQKALAVYALAAEGGGDSAFRVSEACYALAMTLLSESTAADKALLPRPPGVQLAMKFAREKLDQRIGVSEMAAVSGMSLFHFSRVFRDSVGLSPGAFLMEERIRRATTLLHSTTLPIGEVARRCGYTDLNYFVRVFRQSTGMPPGRFRRSGF